MVRAPRLFFSKKERKTRRKILNTFEYIRWLIPNNAFFNYDVRIQHQMWTLTQIYIYIYIFFWVRSRGTKKYLYISNQNLSKRQSYLLRLFPTSYAGNV